MILLFFTLILIASFVYRPKTFIYVMMVYFVLFDMMDGFYETNKVYPAIRYVIPLFLSVLYIIKYRGIKYSDAIFFILVFYLTIILLYNEGDFIISAKNTLALIIALFMLIIGRRLASQENVIARFKPYNRFLMVALPTYILFVNIFNIGESYSEAFTTGFLITSRMYIFPIVLFLAIHYVINYKEISMPVRVLDIALIAINICIIIINTRRTAIGMLFIALLIYTVLYPKIVLKMSVLALVFIGGLALSFPLYEDILKAQLEERERIQNLGTYDEEARYLETLYLIDHHYRKQDISELFFGVKLFDTTEFGSKYFGRDRAIHSDFNMIFYSTGIVGTILFFIFFVHYFLNNNRYIEPENRKLYYAFLAMFCIVLIPGRFIGTFTYAPLLMLLIAATKWGMPESEEVNIVSDTSSESNFKNHLKV